MSKIQYQNYQSTRDLAWEILIQNNVCELPVKVIPICKNMDIPVYTYEKSSKIISELQYEKYCENNDGFSFNGAIYFNDKCSPQRQRFTIAHELLHVIRHENSLYNQEPSETDDEKETEANIFASRLLAPACVLWGLKVSNYKHIQSLCNVSKTAARFRMERLKLLYEREKHFLHTRGKSCFLLSPTERQVYNQFRDYINKNKIKGLHRFLPFLPISGR